MTDLLKRISAVVRQAGILFLTADDPAGCVTEKTSARDLVTKYDPMVQEFLRRELLTLCPDAGFFGEEEERHNITGKERWFVVDPIDGTTNFVRDLHHSCVSVALLDREGPLLGVVYNPYAKELFTARRGAGAFLNGVRLHATDVPLPSSLVLFGSAIYYRQTVPATLRFVQSLLPIALDFRRGGSAALDLCYLAAGRADLFFECCLQPWDYAAGSLIAQEAGCLVTALNGAPLCFTHPCSVAAGGKTNHPQLLSIAARIAAEVKNGIVCGEDAAGGERKEPT